MPDSVAQSLKVVLADSYVLYLKTQNYHWNVTGPNFKSLHMLFEEQYTDLAMAIDEIAERIRTVGDKAPGSFKAFLDITTLAEAKDGLDANAMVEDLSESGKQIVASLKNALKVAQETDDEVTVGLIAERMTVHEKNGWMLRASL